MVEVTDSNDQPITTDGATDTVTSGVEFSANVTCNLIRVLKSSTCDATRAILADATASTISTASFSGDTATFSGDDVLTQGVVYFILVDSSGASYQRRYSNRTNPYVKTNITYLDGKDGANLNDTHWWGIKSITTEEGGAPTMKVNIGDSWKELAALKINIGDAWKEVPAAKINIGDSWKAIG